jgi:hypothetical protein
MWQRRHIANPARLVTLKKLTLIARSRIYIVKTLFSFLEDRIYAIIYF